jgi:hypothetical protein
VSYSSPLFDAVDFDLATGYEIAEGWVYFEAESEGGQPPVSAALDLKGAIGNPRLNLGGTGEEPTNNRSLAISGRTRAPRLAAIVGQILPLAISAQTRAPQFAGKVFDVRRVEVVARTSSPRAIVAVSYDPNLLSDTVGRSPASWREALATDAAHAIRFVEAPGAVGASPAPWRDATAATRHERPGWRSVPASAGSAAAPWRDGKPVAGRAPVGWTGAARAQAARLGRWQGGRGERVGPAASWKPKSPHFDEPLPLLIGPNDFNLFRYLDYPPPWNAVDFPGEYPRRINPGRAGRALHGWRDAGRVQDSLRFRFAAGLPLLVARLPTWRDAGLILYVARLPVVEPPGPWEPTWSARLCLGYPLPPGARLDLGVLGCDFSLREPFTIPRRRSYIVFHDIELVRLSDRLPVAPVSLGISLDCDSWSYAWSGSIGGADALEAVMPSALGEPVILEARIDDRIWHLVVEEWGHDRAFNRRTVRVSGRGLSAELATPAQEATSGSTAFDRTIQQAMAESIPFGSPWSLEFAPGTPDWLIPAGAYGWQNQSPIQAIHQAALSVGLVVIPQPAERVLVVQPRYPVLPWHYDETDPDLVVPDAALRVLSLATSFPAQANAVYVHGQEVGGMLARVWRSGTAGDHHIPETGISPLVTHTDGARLFGSRLLAAQERQPQVRTFELPLGGAHFPLVEIGQLISVELGGDDHRGIANSVGIAVTNSGGKLSVKQTVTIGEETSNQWAAWKRILPEFPLLLGAVSILHGDGTVTVQPIGGGTLRVRANEALALSLGTPVWVKDGRIQDLGPELPSIEIEVF